MAIKASKQQMDNERDGSLELVLAAVTYTGSQSHYVDNSVRQQGHWPSYSGFNRGQAEVAFVPDRGLGFFENRSDFEVDYSREGIASALLGRNYLAPSVFSAGTGGETRQRVLDKLGIERLETTTEGIREQLAGVAGEEDAGGESERTLADELADPDDGYPRSELKAAVKELREDSDDVSLNQGKTDFAEWLAALVEDGDMSQTELHDEIEDAG